MIAWVVCTGVVFQLLPDVLLEVSTTLPPLQKNKGPPAVTLGAAGTGFTVTTRGSETAELHAPENARTVYEPEVVTVMACVV